MNDQASPIIDLQPYRAARIGAVVALLLFLANPPGIAWLIIAIGCSGLAWHARTRGFVWPSGVHDVLRRARLVGAPDEAAARPGEPRVVTAIRRRLVTSEPVMPMRPLTNSEVITGARRALLRHATMSIGFTLAAIIAFLTLVHVIDSTVSDVLLSDSGAVDSFETMIVVLVVVMVGLVLLSVPVDAAIVSVSVVVADRAIRGLPVDVTAVLGRMRHHLWPLCRLTLVLYAVLVIPAWLLVAVAFGAGGTAAGLIVMAGAVVIQFAAGMLFSLAPLVVVSEGVGAMAALARSAELTKPAFWRVLGLHVLWALIGGAIFALASGAVTVLNFALPQGNQLFSVVMVVYLAVALPLFRSAQTIVYTDLRLQEGTYELQPTAGAHPADGPANPRSPIAHLEPFHVARIAGAVALLMAVLDLPGIGWLIIVAGCVVAERITRTNGTTWPPAGSAVLAQFRLASLPPSANSLLE